MLFSSMTFVYLFLPIVCLLYLFSKKELHNGILLIASILFYAWGEPKYLAIMFITIIINYFGAILIDKFQKYKKLYLILTVILNLSFLVYFKYFNFIIDNINSLFKLSVDPINVIMPIGISFYTFQAISYTIDVFRGDVKVQKDIYKLALYICLFPQLIAGPIVKYHDVEEQINSRTVDFEKVQYGVKRFIIGLSKKMLIANTLGAVADKIFVQSPDAFSPLIAWLGAISYTFQLFFDFSGYSDMAIGLGMIFGFKFMENFNYPYISKSITEFWRRWHISLSTWFKEYLYIPLGGSRCSMKRTCFNLGVVFLLTGIWHGANWTFVIWGVWNGFFIILEKITNLHKETNSKPLNFIKHIYAIFIFVIGWVIFRADNINYAFEYIKNMFNLVEINPPSVSYALPYYIDTFEIIAFVAAILCSMPIFKNILNIKKENKILYGLINFWLLILFIISTATIAASTYNPFIYFRF